MSRQKSLFCFTYDDLIKLTGKTLNAVQRSASRGVNGVDSGFVPDDFESVVLWVFRNASDEFRLKILTEMKFFRKTRPFPAQRIRTRAGDELGCQKRHQPS